MKRMGLKGIQLIYNLRSYIHGLEFSYDETMLLCGNENRVVIFSLKSLTQAECEDAFLGVYKQN